ncbi:MAG: hypothetical protein A2X52_04855 [Candidatus Rokubacteria bacterium GWC2_70_16]|nr:MAG: hypothetical protein A2X52_04855 [Candidatus Rokubacteria bacterium GWC2_70_16]
MTGRIEFYDEPTAWGVILGEDGRVYVVRGSRAPGAAPRVGDTVSFEPRDTTTGLRADAVRRAAPARTGDARSPFRRPA